MRGSIFETLLLLREESDRKVEARREDEERRRHDEKAANEARLLEAKAEAEERRREEKLGREDRARRDREQARARTQDLLLLIGALTKKDVAVDKDQERTDTSRDPSTDNGDSSGNNSLEVQQWSDTDGNNRPASASETGTEGQGDVPCRVSWCEHAGKRYGLCWAHGGGTSRSLLVISAAPSTNESDVLYHTSRPQQSRSAATAIAPRSRSRRASSARSTSARLAPARSNPFTTEASSLSSRDGRSDTSNLPCPVERYARFLEAPATDSCRAATEKEDSILVANLAAK
ncbi:hypothetical protein ON010_g12541 [Phytophthora cinnamomi]|nr:hypothetical protein ON010_g12541 [Phytophthora cinnamomi]